MLRVLLAAALLSACASSAVNGGGSGGAGGTGGAAGGGGEPAVEVCDNGVDDDGNGQTDCADRACQQDPHCPFCGDGLRQGPEACDGADVGATSCGILHFNGGGKLACKADCTFDTTGCVSHEECDKPGDEDGNGLADCADPTCARKETCLTLASVDPPQAPVVTTTSTLVVRVVDGTGASVAGKSVSLTAPPGAVAPGGTMTSDAEGKATFAIRLGRAAGDQTFTATLFSASLDITLHAIDPPPLYVHTVVDFDRQEGSDLAGPATAAHVGRVLDLAVAADSTLYLAEACRIVSVSPAGVLALVGGTGSCGSATDGAPAAEAPLAVAALALDEPRHRLLFADASAKTLRSIDLQAGTVTTLAGGGSGEEPGPALGANLAVDDIAVAPDGTVYLSDATHSSIRRVGPDGTLSTVLATVDPLALPCRHPVSVHDCQAGHCKLTVDAGGTPFVSAALCGPVPAPRGITQTTPGLVRLDVGGGGPRANPVLVLGNDAGNDATGQRSTKVKVHATPRAAFDAGGNLLALAGLSLLRVDARTWATRSVAAWPLPAFGGENVPVDTASFSDPQAIAFGPGGDLYIADTGDASVRRIVAVGQDPAPSLTVRPLQGDGQAADLGQKLGDQLAVRVLDPEGSPVVGAVVGFVPDDPGIALYPGDITDEQGVAYGTIRLGVVPGDHTIRASLQDIHGGLAPEPAEFHVTATAPPPGTIFSLTGVDGIDPPTFTLDPGQAVPSMPLAFSPSPFALAPDGTVFASAAATGQIFSITGGVVQVVAGVSHEGADSVDASLALDAEINPKALAATEDAVYFVEGNRGPLRRVDRRTGVLTTVGQGIAAMTLAASSDGTLLAGNFQGVVQVDPVTGTTKVLVPSQQGDCTGDDALASEPNGLAVEGSEIVISARMCHGPGPPTSWVARAGFDGTLQLLVNQYVVDLGVGRDGRILYSTYGTAPAWVIDPVTNETTLLGGGTDQLHEDVPAAYGSALWDTVGGGTDPDGHWLLDTCYRVRVIW